MFENSSNTGNHWIKIKLEGTSSNRSAIGARLRIKVKMADGTFQNFYHSVSTGGSFGSQSLIVNAGLGEADYIEEIEILWPDHENTKQVVKEINLNTEIKIIEDSKK